MRYLSPSRGENSGRASMSIDPSDVVYSIILTQGAAKMVDIPEHAKHVVFASTVDFFVKFGDDDLQPIAIPTQDVMDGSSPEMSPGMRSIDQINVKKMCLVGIEAGQMTLSFYR